MHILVSYVMDVVNKMYIGLQMGHIITNINCIFFFFCETHVHNTHLQTMQSTQNTDLCSSSAMDDYKDGCYKSKYTYTAYMGAADAYLHVCM